MGLTPGWLTASEVELQLDLFIYLYFFWGADLWFWVASGVVGCVALLDVVVLVVGMAKWDMNRPFSPFSHGVMPAQRTSATMLSVLHYNSQFVHLLQLLG